MDAKLTNEDQVESWKCLPDTNTLLQYVNREDLIELSRCCKLYRNLLERRVLEKLTLGTWERKRWGSCNELRPRCKLWEALELLKSDLGSKLKFAKKFRLNCEVDCKFAEIFVKLLPNIKTLQLIGIASEYGCCLGEGLAAILKGLEGLERVYFYDINGTVDYHDIKEQFFPKSIKSLKIDYYVDPYYDYDQSFIYDTIDTSYTNLYFLSIISNRMLQNLSSSMPNLKEVELSDYEGLSQLKIENFLKANHQLKALCTNSVDYNEEVIKTVLSSKYLEYWCINNGSWEGIEVYNFPSNSSIKQLKIAREIPASLALKIINACKSLESLNINHKIFNKLDLLKFEKRVNILKVPCMDCISNRINEIDDSRLFDQVHLDFCISLVKFIEDNIIGDLKNYKFIPLISGKFILKLINK